ncbi:MAG: DEAD/DEAH box helicase, partial [Candidatus Margulisbacteria bacterium]|nr:DEAD/DEAH box helicase [Candidatus Margulisiibacteriota bacterium]
MRAGEAVFVRAEIVRVNLQLTRNRFAVMKVIVADRSGSIQAVWFNQPYLTKLFRPGMRLLIAGRVEFSSFDRFLQLIPRDFEIDTGGESGVVPSYPLTEGLYQKKLRSVIENAVGDCLELLEDNLPKAIKKEYNLMDLWAAVEKLHFPAKMSDVELARHRLAFDDFFFFQLNLELHRKKMALEQGIAFDLDQNALAEFLTALPFKLTCAQARVLAEILADMQAGKPMNRLLQGDVGSGKTIVALIAAFVAVQNKQQVAFMVPTEILAGQHFEKIKELFKGRKIKVESLTGSTSKAKNKASAIQKADIIIGTHALVQANVKYRSLGLVIVDEQHRFGVLQRASLVKKGRSPDILIMTATPIPRSLSLTLYGELDRSVIDELPPGRTPIQTGYVPEEKRAGAYDFMKQKLKEGRQIFVICPLV